MLTTLTVAVVTQLKNSDRFIVCTCNVGDSLAYVYSRKHGVREITQGMHFYTTLLIIFTVFVPIGSHDIFSMRDMRDALGALGPVDGQNPELNNLTVAMTIVDKGDIVFLTSDGVSDNFDPVVGKFAIPKKKGSNDVTECDNSSSQVDSSKGTKSTSTESSKRRHQIRLRRSNSNPDRDSAHKPSPDPGLPVVTAEQRHELTLLRMEDILRNGLKEGDKSCVSAKRLCEMMIEFVSQLTVAKRRILEDPELYTDEDEFGQVEQRRRRRRVGDKLAMVPGKLDHASVVAYKVGFRGDFLGKKFEDPLPSDRRVHDTKYNLKLK